ncbi:hypothetical protein [Thiomicrorhabdus sp. 6S3-12]|uniref:DUF7281 domain-containing protein n=1 Tax=Thiomicrorhabdus sp. 6S3-12 TaxID=2819681 RepID=UPI001AAD2E91|nr:hypothetical protein [Thiomicrorhabdus sp. 6S3-12]MBO1924579.1 hypothetical protein [Thiomicrorhabdus sp. 6S3-12]
MFNQQQLKTLQSIIAKRMSYQSKAKWLIGFCEDTGIGSVKSNIASFGIKDIEYLESYLIANGFPIESLSSDFDDRIEASKYVGNEKITSNAVTHEHVLALFPKRNYSLNHQNLPRGRALDLTVQEALSLNVKEVIVVENLAVFLNAIHYSNLLSMLSNHSMLIFRGMAGCYSLKGSVSLIGLFKGERVGLFDFDPVGLSAIGHKDLDSMLVPDLGELRDRLDKKTLVSDPMKYSSQKALTTSDSLNAHAEFINTNRLAVSQEYMIATNLKLEKINLR